MRLALLNTAKLWASSGTLERADENLPSDGDAGIYQGHHCVAQTLHICSWLHELSSLSPEIQPRLERHTASKLTHLVDSTRQCQIPVFAVHVVRSRARVVSEPDAVVLDDAGVLLRQLES